MENRDESLFLPIFYPPRAWATSIESMRIGEQKFKSEWPSEYARVNGSLPEDRRAMSTIAAAMPMNRKGKGGLHFAMHSSTWFVLLIIDLIFLFFLKTYLATKFESIEWIMKEPFHTSFV